MIFSQRKSFFKINLIQISKDPRFKPTKKPDKSFQSINQKDFAPILHESLKNSLKSNQDFLGEDVDILHKLIEYDQKNTGTNDIKSFQESLDKFEHFHDSDNKNRPTFGQDINFGNQQSPYFNKQDLNNDKENSLLNLIANQEELQEQKIQEQKVFQRI